MKQRIFALLLALGLSVSLALPAMAAPASVTQEEAAQGPVGPGHSLRR